MSRAPRRRRPAAARGPVAAAAPVEVALCVVLAALGALVYGKFFEGRYLTPLLGAAALGAAVAMLADLFSWRAWVAAAVAALAFVPYAAFVAFPELATSSRLPGPAAVRAVVEGLVNGWARMLSIGLPADVTGELLVTPLFLTWTVALAAILALRSRAALAPLLPPLLGFVAALAFTASRPERQLEVTAGLLATGLLLALLRANRLGATDRRGPMVAAAGADPAGGGGRVGRGRSAMLGRVAFGVPIVALVTALGVAGAATLPIATGARRFDPSRLRTQQLEVDDTLSPLVQLKAQLETSPAVELFTVTLERPAGGTPAERLRIVNRLRTAALDRYDGALWTTDDHYIVTGRTLPAGQPLRGRVVPVTQRVTVDRLAGPFLPAAGRPAAMTARDFGFDPDSGVLVTPRPTLQGYRYELSSAVARPTAAQLEAALPNPSPALAPAAAPPADVPAELRALADQITAGQVSPYAQLKAIERYLRGYPYDLRGRPGHSYGRLLQLLSGSRAERRGFAEQHAAAFALLSRIKGFPARVAVGYLLSRRNLDGDGRVTVTTANAHAWPEVNFEGYGWVGFEPTDLRRTGQVPPEQDQGSGVEEAGSSQAPEALPPEIVAQLDPNVDPAAGSLRARAQRAARWLAVAVVAVALCFGLVVLAKGLRRARRRRARTAAGRIVGAWRETTDRLRERGVRVGASLTAGEVAEGAGDRLGAGPAAPVAELAPIVTAAVFAPFEPDPQLVRRAWRLESSARRELRRVTPPVVRVRALADPRPLLPARSGRPQHTGNGDGRRRPA